MYTKWPESLWCLKELELWRSVILSQEALTDYFIFQLRWISLGLAESESEVAQSCPTLCNHMDTRLLRPWDFLGKSTGVGCHFLCHGIFPTQGSNPGLPHCRQTLYHQSHQGSLADWGLNEGEGHVRSWEVGRPVSRDMGCHSNRPPALHPIRYGQCLWRQGKQGL